MQPAPSHRSPILDKLLKQMEADPWQVKFKRWLWFRWWLFCCSTRWLLDTEYQHNIFRKWLFLAVPILLLSCSPSFHLKQAERHLRKAELKGAQARVDTVYKTVSVIVPQTHFDTVLTHVNFRDTITLEKDKIVTKIKFDTITRGLYVQTVCPPDTLRIEVPITVTKEIKSGWPKWWLLLAALGGAGLVAILRRR